jgi:hypothetical protein
VVLDHVEAPGGEHAFDRGAVHDRAAELLRQQASERAEARLEPDDGETFGGKSFGLGLGSRIGPLRERPPGVDVVHDGDRVPAAHEGAREALHADRVPAEVERRIEGRQEGEAQRPHAAASSIASSTARAARSQERSRARASATRPSSTRRGSSAHSARSAARSASSFPGATKIPPPASRSGSGLAVVGHDRRPARRGLDGREAEALALRRDDAGQRAGVEEPQLLVGEEAGPVHEASRAPGLDRGLDRGDVRVERVAVARADEAQVRRVGDLAGEPRVRPREEVDVLVRVEAADVDEHARSRGQSGALCRAADLVGRGPGAEDGRGASPVTRIRARGTRSTDSISPAAKSDTVTTRRAWWSATFTLSFQKSRARAEGSVRRGKRSAIASWTVTTERTPRGAGKKVYTVG